MVSVSPTYRRYAVVCVALLLVFNPFYLDPLLHFDDPNRYEYHAESIQFREDGFPANLSNDVLGRSVDDDIACFLYRDRVCALEAHILEHGGTLESNDTFRPSADYDFAYIDGQFYTVEVSGQTSDTPAQLRLTETTRERALETAATPFARASPGARAVITDGPVTRRTQIPDEYQLVERDDTYYVVYPKYGRFYGEEAFEERRQRGTILEGVLSAFGVVVGLGLWTVVSHRR
jgi:hypothetical protein